MISAKGFIHITGTKADILPSCSTGLGFFHDRVKTHTHSSILRLACLVLICATMTTLILHIIVTANLNRLLI